MTANNPYLFGDNAIAEERLEYLANAYEESSRAWFNSLEFKNCNLAVDLGCGIGRTTALLAEHFVPRQIVGLDSSSRFLNRARSRSHASFIAHDVTQSPFPIPPADLLYERFLLTHLAKPDKVLVTWSQALITGGVLLMEETADLRSEHPVFSRYYQIVEAMQSHYGQTHKIGRDIDHLIDPRLFEIVQSDIRVMHISPKVMGRLHAMNIYTWKNDGFIRENIPVSEVAAITAFFEQVAIDGSAPPVRSEMRQAMLRKR